MAVSSTFQTFVVEQLQRAGTPVKARRMFGGVGIYSGDLFFALIAGDVLYFKVDDATRDKFLSLGMPPFRPFGEGGATMQYYQVPESILDDPDELRPWVEDAIAVARRARKADSKKPKPRKKTK